MVLFLAKRALDFFDYGISLNSSSSKYELEYLLVTLSVGEAYLGALGISGEVPLSSEVL